jgi:hypothetical protein
MELVLAEACKRRSQRRLDQRQVRRALETVRVDVEDWLVCVDGPACVLHLAYLSADRNVTALLPWELLSRAEKRGGRKMT